MKKILVSFLGLLILAFVACKESIPDPEQTILLSPEDNTSCLYVSNSSTTASVDFSWEETEFTDQYKVVIRN